MTDTLTLSLHVAPVAAPRQAFPVTARFTNAGHVPLRLLDLFEPFPVFFTTALIDEHGGEIDVAAVGKLDALAGSLHYRDLVPGASLDIGLDLAPWIDGPLPAGEYTLAIAYHNVYGDDCFKGAIDSAPVPVSVGADGVARS